MNATGSGRVSWASAGLISGATADALIHATETAMHRYAALGLETAKVSALDPVKIAVRAGDDSPAYRPLLSVVQVGAVAAETVATDAGRFELWHELVHWIEDENYAMLWAYLNDALKWWMETAAEGDRFMIEPGG